MLPVLIQNYDFKRESLVRFNDYTWFCFTDELKFRIGIWEKWQNHFHKSISSLLEENFISLYV